MNKILRTMGCWLVARSWDLSCTWGSCRLVSCTWVASMKLSFRGLLSAKSTFFRLSRLVEDSCSRVWSGFFQERMQASFADALRMPSSTFWQLETRSETLNHSRMFANPSLTPINWHPSRHPLVCMFSMKRSEKILKDMKRWRSRSGSMVLCSVRLKSANPLHFFRIHSGLACNQFAWQRDSTQMLTWKLPIAAPCDDVSGSAVRCSWTTTSMTISVRMQVHAPLGRPSPCVEMCQISPWKIEIFKKSNMIASYNTKNF